ncbi:MAG: aminomethyl-transferring glycine dehydrogenase subunit GcvPA [Gammaproteobacteria bacterium]|nr:aminomethyl-transferring glycine dehydrogenase subunit GcvPA [Gammaproteobacteria bacterium]MDH5728707.1 aminomethyl-transferring glycine dehydrogenase subunit GcvPA [Gammaproteobacteria bacterium]
MPFIPHTEQQVRHMLDTIGANKIEDLFDEIPASLKNHSIEGVPSGLTEMEVGRLMRERAAQDGVALCFAGGGAYEHHIPAAVWEIATRGEFYSAYTPYQAEASQGTLQLIYEYQSMMASLTGMDVSNASLYDGASGLAEAVLMAVRGNRKSKSKRILMPRSVNPRYRDTTKTIVTNQGITLEAMDFDVESGQLDVSSLPSEPGDFAALVIAQPNYFGVLENVDALVDWAHSHGALVIAVVNPTSLALLKAPGQWGSKGADIVCGDGQPLGIPMSSGGPFFGFLCATSALVRQMPGRIVGRTVDTQGRNGFTLTLQAREQHIRRSKATSNICTNQGLMVTAATIYMSLMGPEGLRNVATQSYKNTQQLVSALCEINGVQQRFNGPFFHESVLQLPIPASQAIDKLLNANVLAGIDLSRAYDDLNNCLLVCVTETKTDADIEKFKQALVEIL